MKLFIVRKAKVMKFSTGGGTLLVFANTQAEAQALLNAQSGNLDLDGNELTSAQEVTVAGNINEGVTIHYGTGFSA